MSVNSSSEILENYLQWWQAHTHRLAELHNQFLELRQAGLQQVAGAIQGQVASSRPLIASPARPLFTPADLNEFALGSVVACLGPEYAVYAGRRSPRIPNGDFLLISRVLSIRGRKGQFDQPSAILAEYDVPAAAWYFDGATSGRLPYSICLEIALQPCGILTAFLGTPLRYPEFDYYFRNLDGETLIHRPLDLRGQTVQVRAELLKTVFYGAIIIQYFSFELSCAGQVFFAGKSSFGYFSADALASQAGLDGGKKVSPWLAQAGSQGNLAPVDPAFLDKHLPKGRLRLLDKLLVDPAGGRYRQGYAYASRINAPTDWFYACHFHQDPVMPGSLGIEAVIQAMQLFAGHSSDQLVSPAAGQKITWTYRGQVLQSHRQMQLELHFQQVRPVGEPAQLTADASLWADDTRIYAVKNLSLPLAEPPL